MYQGCDSKEELVSRMAKDKVVVDIDKYTVEKALSKFACVVNDTALTFGLCVFSS